MSSSITDLKLKSERGTGQEGSDPPTDLLHLIAFECDVRFWPKADLPSCTAHVRFWGVKQT
jgi:hypothetical protein